MGSHNHHRLHDEKMKRKAALERHRMPPPPILQHRRKLPPNFLGTKKSAIQQEEAKVSVPDAGHQSDERTKTRDHPSFRLKDEKNKRRFILAAGREDLKVEFPLNETFTAEGRFSSEEGRQQEAYIKKRTAEAVELHFGAEATSFSSSTEKEEMQEFAKEVPDVVPVQLKWATPELKAANKNSFPAHSPEKEATLWKLAVQRIQEEELKDLGDRWFRMGSLKVNKLALGNFDPNQTIAKNKSVVKVIAFASLLYLVILWILYELLCFCMQSVELMLLAMFSTTVSCTGAFISARRVIVKAREESKPKGMTRAETVHTLFRDMASGVEPEIPAKYYYELA